MTLRSTLTTLGLIAALTIGVLRPTSAMPQQAAGASSDLYSACIQECIDAWHENKEDCKKSAKICDFWILWTCLFAHTNQDMLDKCIKEADEALAACKAGCQPQP